MAFPTVTIGGVDRTSMVSTVHPLSIEDTRAATPSTALFTVDGIHGYRPALGATVTMVLAGRTLFSGQITNREQVFSGNPQHALYHCSCVGWGRLFDAKRVYGKWKNHSATDLIGHVVSGFTSGFTTTHVESSMATVDEFTAAGETPSECLTAIMERIGGRWYLDESKDLHAFTTLPEPAVEQPDALTDTNCRNITSRVEWGDVVTRQSVEGMTTALVAPCAEDATILAVAGCPVREPASGLPEYDMRGFSAGGGTIRVTPTDGSAPYTATYTGIVDGGNVFGHAQAGLGGTYLNIASTAELALFPSSGWASVNGMVVRYTSKQATPPISLQGVPYPVAISDIYIVSGQTVQITTGSAHGLSVGDWVTVLATGATPAGYNGTFQVLTTPFNNVLTLEVHALTLASGSTGWVGPAGWVTADIGSGSPIFPSHLLTGVSGILAHDSGTLITSVVVSEDATAQTALAAADGSDGIRDGAVLTGSDMTASEAVERGTAELSVRKNPETRLTYETTDPKTRAGTCVLVQVGNRLANSEFLTSLAEPNGDGATWRLGYNDTGASWRIDLNMANWYPAGSGAAFFETHDSPATGSQYVYGPTFAVTAGQSYEWSAYLGVHRLSAAGLYVAWINAGGTVFDGSWVACADLTKTGGTALTGYVRTGAVVTAPAGAVNATLGLYATVNGQANPYLFFTHLQWRKAAPGQTGPSPWAPAWTPTEATQHLITRVSFSGFSANGSPVTRVETTDRKYSPVSLWARLKK